MVQEAALISGPRFAQNEHWLIEACVSGAPLHIAAMPYIGVYTYIHACIYVHTCNIHERMNE